MSSLEHQGLGASVLTLRPSPLWVSPGRRGRRLVIFQAFRTPQALNLANSPPDIRLLIFTQAGKKVYNEIAKWVSAMPCRRLWLCVCVCAHVCMCVYMHTCGRYTSRVVLLFPSPASPHIISQFKVFSRRDKNRHYFTEKETEKMIKVNCQWFLRDTFSEQGSESQITKFSNFFWAHRWMRALIWNELAAWSWGQRLMFAVEERHTRKGERPGFLAYLRISELRVPWVSQAPNAFTTKNTFKRCPSS